MTLEQISKLIELCSTTRARIKSYPEAASLYAMQAELILHEEKLAMLRAMISNEEWIVTELQKGAP